MTLEGKNIKPVKNREWQRYQKEIADDNFYLARSCIRQNFFPAAEDLFINILRNHLSKDIYDDPAQTTCTGIAYHSAIVPMETTMTVVARQFALMNESGYKNFAVSCVTSFGIYTEMLETWHHFPHLLEKTRDLLYKSTGKEFTVPENIVHTSDLIFKFRKEISSQLKYRLINKETGEPLKVVDHIGCHYAKIFPEQAIGGSEYPYVLAGLTDEFGGEQVDYPERRHCCGFGFRQYLLKSNRGYSVANSKIKLDSMKPFNPDLIICNCPGCTYFLDRWQYVISEMDGTVYSKDGYGIPVLTYEEITALLLGYDPWKSGLQLHQVAVEPLLKKIGIQFDQSQKYLGADGEDLGVPNLPSVLKQ